MTLNEYFDFWLDVFAKSGRKATTCTNYKSYFDNYIRNGIGQKMINKITKLDCQSIINAMVKQGLHHSTLANLKSCLNIVFECALDDDIISKNPKRNIQLPHTETRKKTALEQTQIETFLKYIKNSDRYSYTYSAFVVLFNTGMRIGEMCALTWNDINFDKNTISVNKSLNRYRKKDYGFTLAIASPKSITSIRTIPMNSVMRNILLKHKMKSEQSASALPYLDDYGNVRGEISDFVFTNAEKTAWCEPTFRKLITRIVNSYNREYPDKPITDFCPHEVRHTYTSLAYCAGADIKVVSEILGHASTAVTLNTYTHLTAEKQREQEKIVQSIRIS
jgi:site-specific recombinase XerD